jgi:hypothetical protein
MLSTKRAFVSGIIKGDVVIEGLTLLICTSKAPGSKLGPETVCHD